MKKPNVSCGGTRAVRIAIDDDDRRCDTPRDDILHTGFQFAIRARKTDARVAPRNEEETLINTRPADIFAVSRNARRTLGRMTKCERFYSAANFVTKTERERRCLLQVA